MVRKEALTWTESLAVARHEPVIIYLTELDLLPIKARRSHSKYRPYYLQLIKCSKTLTWSSILIVIAQEGSLRSIRRVCISQSYTSSLVTHSL